MSNIDKQALIAKIKKQTESFDTVVLKEDEAVSYTHLTLPTNREV